MYFQMSGLINMEMEEKFISFYNLNHDNQTTIILNTGGGGYFHAESLVKMINEMKDVTIFVQAASSAGFFLLYYTKCKLIISKTARAMWHFGRWEISMNDKGKAYYREDECVLSHFPFHSRESKRIARTTMNKKEYTQFLKDDDVYFNTKRMREIFAGRL